MITINELLLDVEVYVGHDVYINIEMPQWNIVKLLYLCSLCALQCNNYAHESTEVVAAKAHD